MSLNWCLEEIVGKTISGVVAKDGSRQMVMIVFTDNTYMELFGSDLNNTKGLWPGGMKEALNYCPDLQVVQKFGE
jgi:hypothetical protein